MESTESVSGTAAIDGLIDDQMGGVPSATSDVEAAPATETPQTPEPTPEVTTQEPVSTSTEASQSQSGEVSQTSPPPVPTFKIGDRDYTQDEIRAALTSAQQLPHLQKKYMDVLEQSRQQSQPQQNQQFTPQQGSQEQWLQQVQLAYQPEIKSLVDKGLISKDYATLFPNELAQQLYYRDGFNRLAQQVQRLEQGTQQRTQQEQATGLINDIGNNINALAQSGEAFAPLKDPNEARGFVQYLWNMDPKVAQLRDPQFLAGQWVAYKRDTYLSNFQAQQVQTQRANQARFAKADASTGSRPPGGFQQEVKSPLDQMVDDFLATRNS